MYIACGHVTSDAIVCRCRLFPRLRRSRAARSRMTAKTLAVEVRRRFRGRRLNMRIVATDASKLLVVSQPPRSPKTLAQAHRVEVLQVIVIRRIFARRRNLKNCNGLIQRFAWPEVLVRFARLQHPRVAQLMARHADVIRKLPIEPRRIDDRRVKAFGHLALPHRLNVRCSRPMAVFAAHRGLREDSAVIPACESSYRLRS